MSKRTLLAFDFGASSGRAIRGVFNGSTLTMETVHQFPNGAVSAMDHLYWDILRFFEELREGIRRSTQNSPGPLSGIGIDTWGVDYGLLDKDGDLLGVPYHYRDRRTEGMFEEAFRRMPREEIFAHTGLAFQPFNTLFQLLAMRVTKPELLDKARTLLLMPDLLSYYLTGVMATEYTDASTTQLLNVHSRTWDENLLARMGFPRGIFTEIQSPGTIRGVLHGSIAAETGVTPCPVISVTSHDTASAVLAVPLPDQHYAYLSSGTWSLLGVERREPALNDNALRWNFTNEGGFDGTIRILRNVMGLWIIQECKREWDGEGSPATFEELTREAERSPGMNCFVDPDDPSFYPPGPMVQRVQAYCERTHQPVPRVRGEIVRCVLESLALKYRWVVEHLEQVVGYRVQGLYIVGGGVRNTLLNKLTANALKRPVWGGPPEATGMGNLLVQLHALGEVHGLTQMRALVRASNPPVLYEPFNEEAWDHAYERFERLVIEN
jgi:rhamnulokinase